MLSQRFHIKKNQLQLLFFCLENDVHLPQGLPVSANANNESIDKDAQINDVALQSVPYDDPDINEFLKQAKVPTTDINEFLKQAKVPPTGILTQ